MMKTTFSIVILLCCARLILAQQKPNIVFILSDDAGYADFSFQTNRLIPTPNIDRIANEGVKFNNAYVSSAVCSPSRAGILTGRNQATFGNVYNFIQGQQYNISKEEFGIPINVKLVGDYLKPLGYTTGMVGKWHEGFSKKFQPNQRGFDYFWGFLWGSSPYLTGKALQVQENGRPVVADSIPYMTDAIAEKAVSFIERSKEKSFFLYVSFNAVHAPQQVKASDTTLFSNKFPDKNRLKNAVMTHNLDENVGRILQALEKNNLINNTLIVFANDNGGEMKNIHADNYPLRGGKSEAYEGGIRVPMAMRWPGKIKPGSVSDNVVSTLDLVPTFLTLAKGKSSSEKFEGRNLLDEATDKSTPERTLYWRFSRNDGAMRQGKWKLIYHKRQASELYNLEKDGHEDHNLFSSEKETAKRLLGIYTAWFNNLPPLNFYPLDENAKE